MPPFQTIMDQMNNPVVTHAMPFLLAFIAIEAVLMRIAGRREGRTGYSGIDTRTSLTFGLGAAVATLVYQPIVLVAFILLWTHVAPWHIPTHAWWSWVLLLVLLDIAYYFYHRFSHRVRIGWAGHQAHHSSQYFNLSVALRHKWNPWIEPFFWIPLPLLGFEPWTLYIAFSFNLLYQFFAHTDMVGRLPRPIEFIFNTPSHHRVHHGRDDEYLDKNYAGILIIWDRMFGTFQAEMHTPTYGLRKQVETYNPFKLQYYGYGDLIRDLRNAHGWRDKLGYIFGPPGWQPAHITDVHAANGETAKAAS